MIHEGEQWIPGTDILWSISWWNYAFLFTRMNINSINWIFFYVLNYIEINDSEAILFACAFFLGFLSCSLFFSVTFRKLNLNNFFINIMVVMENGEKCLRRKLNNKLNGFVFAAILWVVLYCRLSTAGHEILQEYI